MAAIALEVVREKAAAWLTGRQDPSGAWMLHLRVDAPVPSVALTALALTALRESDSPGAADVLGRGADWLAARQNPDGSFGDGEDGLFYRPYCTALALGVLARDPRRHAEQIARAVGCLRENQRADGIDRGGIGHGMIGPAPTAEDPGARFTRAFAMISPTAMAAQSMRRAGFGPGDPFLTAAADYVRACQNDPGINTRPEVARFLADNGYRWSGDGGVISTHENLRRTGPWAGTAQPAVASSGISTYQGICAYLAAGLSPGSREVGRALEWARGHYSVTEHAGLAEVMRRGQRPLWPTEHAGYAEPAARSALSTAGPDQQEPDLGLAGRYLYLRSMARALHGSGIDLLETADGRSHAWRAEIAEVLAGGQDPEGFWANENPRWLEFDAVLSTAFALDTVNTLTRHRGAPSE